MASSASGDRACGADGSARVSPLAVGVVVWLASELMFFAGLFAAYYTLRSSNAVWPPPGVELNVPRALVLTVVLLASSVTMHFAVKAADRGDRRQCAALAGGHVPARHGLPREPRPRVGRQRLHATSNAYGSIYYLLTGFHGLHVLGGLVLMIAAAVAVSGHGLEVPLGPTFTVSAYYWHFVDVVWLACSRRSSWCNDVGAGATVVALVGAGALAASADRPAAPGLGRGHADSRGQLVPGRGALPDRVLVLPRRRRRRHGAGADA